MREILFRGKRNKIGDFVEGSLIVYPDGDCYIARPSDDPCVLDKFCVDPATVGQYTGLTDKYGKRIFEGDIVIDLTLYLAHKSYFERGTGGEEHFNKWRTDAQPSLVRFSAEDIGSCGCCYPAFEGSGFRARDGVSLLCCEVIGNIHDNPELLKEVMRKEVQPYGAPEACHPVFGGP